MKVGMLIGKVKKFEIGWCIPHRMAADNAEGGSGLYLYWGELWSGFFPMSGEATNREK